MVAGPPRSRASRPPPLLVVQLVLGQPVLRQTLRAH